METQTLPIGDLIILLMVGVLIFRVGIYLSGLLARLLMLLVNISGVIVLLYVVYWILTNTPQA